MATLQDYRDERLRKLQELKNLGVNPYPAESHRTHGAGDVVNQFEELKGQTATIAGRIVGIRKFGKLAFIVLKDFSGQVQLFLRDGDVQTLGAPHGILGMKELVLLDTGDFVEATGEVIKTQTGEISIDVKTLRLLTKSLRPMPLELTNKEERMRRRYVDMNVNQDVRDRFVRRSKFWQATRDFLNQHDFIEVNVPVLEHTTGGADANPFVTHMDALDQDFYLRISHELPLKRLLGAGFEKVYDIGPRFRNENYSDEHLPEHVAMEFYWAYADWMQGMVFMESLIKHVLEQTFGTQRFALGKFKVDLEKEWERWDYAETIQKRYHLDIFNCTLEDVKKVLKDNNLEVEQTENKARGIDKLWKNIRRDVAGPIWLINTPTFISPLAKTNPDRPETTQRFQAVIAGSELTNDFSELNDPLDQLQRFVDQQRMRDAGDDEAMMLDIDFVEMLEYGMPPACGFSYSERLFWIFEGVTAREGVPFPQLRTEIDNITREVYPQVSFETEKVTHAPERPQDFSKRAVVVVNKELESWQMANAVAHMSAYIGKQLGHEKFGTGDYFETSDGKKLPRNSQYPIIVKRATEAQLHTLLEKVREERLEHHVFIKEMQDTSNDNEIVQRLRNQTEDETIFYGLTVFGENQKVDTLTKKFQLLS